MATPHVTRSTRDPQEAAGHLQRWLTTILPPGSNPAITEIASPASNGMSSETLLFNARWVDDGVPIEQRLVARVEPASSDHPVFTSYDLGKQLRVMRMVGEKTEVPVPETLWFEPDRTVLGGPFLIMARVDGLVPPDVLPYTFGDNWVFDMSGADRQNLRESVIRAIVGIHSLSAADHDLTFLEHSEPGANSLERSLNHLSDYCEMVVGASASPLLARCFDWLRDNVPADTSADALSWGDARIGNMMFTDNQVVAVLAWEMAEVAPPEVGLGWLCYLHMFFQDLAVQLGGPGLPDLLQPAEVRRGYGRIAGITPGDLTWHIFYAAVRHGLNMRRVSERAIRFGAAERPDDIDDLIMHRSTLSAMLNDSYWSGISL
jgi:aminoglycoside phosphotransferase (APT) family kinase protein